MQLAVIGTGYVGLTSAVCFAELGHRVIGVDIDEKKIEKLKNGVCTIYEPELEELLKRNLANGRLTFTTDIREALPVTKAVFSAVATPPNEDFSADLRAVFIVAESVARHADHSLVFINKSTVPVGTGKKCEEIITHTLKDRGMDIEIPVVSNPEFLREGHAVHDTLQPDRIVVGMNGTTSHQPLVTSSKQKLEARGQRLEARGQRLEAKEILEDLYRPLTRTQKPIVWMNRESAEIVKYASNAFLATKISFINMLSELCEQTGANIRDIGRGMGMDDRIGPRFLHAGIGYGGSCFPKDVKALMALSKETGIALPIVDAVHEINEHQRVRTFKKFIEHLPVSAKVCVLGLSFKPRTDDMREAPSIDLIHMLKEAGHTVVAHDPIAMENAKQILGDDITYQASIMNAIKDADAVAVLTEWDEFRGIDFALLKEQMKGNLLFDGRNMYEPEEVEEAGLRYVGIGIKSC